MQSRLKFLVVIILLPILTTAQECTTFNDIDSSTYKQDILYASDKNWVTCKDISFAFNPTTNTSRIEALKMALLASGHTPPETTEQCFVDVPIDSWQNKYACYAKNNDMVVGKSSCVKTDAVDGFCSSDDINFAEASKMILKSMTSDNYGVSDPWYQKYLDKMALYPFNDSAESYVNRDYFVHILREIEADPNKQPTVTPPPVVDPPVDEPTPIIVDTPPVVTPPIVEDVIPVAEVVGDTAIGGLSYWFTPYRCFDSVAPSLELKIQNDTTDSANNRILDLEYYTSGGSQSCVDTEGDSHTLAFGTRWRAEGLEFGDLTSDEDRGIYKYKKVRVTVPSGKATEIRLAVITTLGKVMVKSLFIDENGEITTNKTTTYGLNGIEITDTNILAKIKLLIAELESIKLEVEALLSEARQKVVNSDDTLKKKFDAIKKRLDDAKKLLDDIKQAIDNSNEDKTTLKKEADKIKKAIDDIKKLIDGYKKNDDNSVTAIDDIKSAIDDVIGMMVSESSERVSSLGVDVPKGRSTISGAIDVTKLADTIYAVWMVDGGNWYGYSPDSDIRKKIKAKYRLIEGIIPPYKATIVWALEDTYITFENSYSVPNVTQSYGNGFSIHGTNNMTLSTDEIVCDNNNKSISGIFKVLSDVPSVFVPNREINSTENFTYIYSDEGYYVLCEEKQGGS